MKNEDFQKVKMFDSMQTIIENCKMMAEMQAQAIACLQNTVTVARQNLAPENSHMVDSVRQVKTPSTPEKKVKKEKNICPVTWYSEVRRILEEKNRGMTYKQIKTELRKSTLAKKLKNTRGSSNTLYATVSNLKKDGLVTRHDGKTYSIKAFEIFSERVRDGLEKDICPISKRDIAEESVKKLLNNRGEKGATKEDIKKELSKNEELKEITEKNPNFVSNLLKFMKKNARVQVK